MARLRSQQVLVSPSEMAELDRRTIEELGVPSLDLMEAAAQACVGVIRARCGHLLPHGSLVFCGPGNNGGDGLAIARILANEGHPVEVVLVQRADGPQGDSVHQLDRLRSVGVEPRVVALECEEVQGSISSTLKQPSIVVDALFGIGLCREVRGVARELVEWIVGSRTQGAFVLSVDTPSGVHGGSGQILGAAVEADITVSFAAAKRGHFQEPGRTLRGELLIEDIGIPVDQWPSLLDGASTLLSSESVIEASPKPRNHDHKGRLGHVLVVAGGPGKCGAARLCAEAALRGGAGLVTLAVPACLPLDSLAQLRPEVMVERVPGSGDGRFTMGSFPALSSLCESRDVLVVGPGIGTERGTRDLAVELFVSIELPAVFDADALNCLAVDFPPCGAGGARILTPHPGESHRLLVGMKEGRPVDRVGEALALARGCDSVVVLKGAGTVIADQQGRNAINPTGNVGMATAGSGDVLAGLVAALLARGARPFDAACGAAFWHGHAGDLAAQRLGKPTMLAGDITETLSSAWLDLKGEE